MLTLGLTTAASVISEITKTMWKIIVTTNPGKLQKEPRVLTTSKYPTKEEAEAAAEQLRLLTAWKKGTPCHEKTTRGKFKFYNYLVTDPTQC